MKRDESVYLRHILDAIIKAEEYLQGLDEAAFNGNSLVQDGPSQPLTLSWHILTGRFQQLIELGSLNAGGPAYCLEQIRVRAGRPFETQARPNRGGLRRDHWSKSVSTVFAPDTC